MTNIWNSYSLQRKNYVLQTFINERVLEVSGWYLLDLIGQDKLVVILFLQNF